MTWGRQGPGRRARGGHAAVEIALMAPWIFFLFIGVLDFGFYAYAAIATQNAARVGAMYTSSSSTLAADRDGACQYILEELRWLPNVKSAVTVCTALPVNVTAELVDPGVDGAPASRVAVTYETIPMIPIPGLMTGRLTLTRAAEMRIKE